MSVRIKELKEKRMKLVADARALQDGAEAEKRALTTDEGTRHDAMLDEVETMTTELERLERLERMELEQRARQNPEPVVKGDPEKRTKTEEEAKKHAEIFRRYLKHGQAALTGEDIEFIRSMPECRAMSAFSADSAAVLAPQEWSSQLLENLGLKVAVRANATVISVNTLAGLGVVTLDADSEEADWTGELSTPATASDIGFGKRELRPHQLTKRILLPMTLLQSSTLNIDAIASDRMSKKVGRAEENAFTLGDGSSKPLGLFTASSFGINTDRDVVCGGTTDFTFDGLIDVQDALREEYRAAAKWYFHRNSVKRLRKLKDGEGRYLWEPSVRAGEPDLILGSSFFTSDYVPNTFTTGQYVGMYGDFKYYWIIDFAFNYLQRLNELYAETNRIAIIIRKWTDGAPVMPEAFVRMKLG